MVPSAVRLSVFCVRAHLPSHVIPLSDNPSVTGYGVEKVGFRPFLLGVLFYQCAVTTIFFVAPSVKILLVAECLAGIAFGVFMSGKSTFEHCFHMIDKSFSCHLLCL